MRQWTHCQLKFFIKDELHGGPEPCWSISGLRNFMQHLLPHCGHHSFVWWILMRLLRRLVVVKLGLPRRGQLGCQSTIGDHRDGRCYCYMYTHLSWLGRWMQCWPRRQYPHWHRLYDRNTPMRWKWEGFALGWDGFDSWWGVILILADFILMLKSEIHVAYWYVPDDMGRHVNPWPTMPYAPCYS
jgi:hypothetical protein